LREFSTLQPFATILTAPTVSPVTRKRVGFSGARARRHGANFSRRAGEAAWSQLLDKRSLCAPLNIGAKTLGAGFVSIDHTAKGATVDVCLSVTETTADGVSIFDDWTSIVKDTKDDLNTEILLHLNLGAATLRDLDIDGFKSGKRLGTVDLELEVRPSAIQFSRDD
jgi:hypothetical protein